MDTKHLDHLARTISGTNSRRRAIRLLASAALGGLLGGPRARPGAAAPCALSPASCRNDGQCCSGNCSKQCHALADGTRLCNPGGLCCPFTSRNCGGRCINLRIDEAHCGACGHACPGGQTCCGGECVDTRSDRRHCGGCNHACAVDVVCCNGTCCGRQQFCTLDEPRRCFGV